MIHLSEAISSKKTGKYTRVEQLTEKSKLYEFINSIRSTSAVELEYYKDIPDSPRYGANNAEYYNVSDLATILVKKSIAAKSPVFCIVPSSIPNLWIASPNGIVLRMQFVRGTLEQVQQYEWDDHYDEIRCIADRRGGRLSIAMGVLKDMLKNA